MSEEIKGNYSTNDSDSIPYKLLIERADDLKGLLQGSLTIDKKMYDVQGSYSFKDGKHTPAEITLKIARRFEMYDANYFRGTGSGNIPSRRSDDDYYAPLPDACGEFKLTSEANTWDDFKKSFEQLRGQGTFQDKETGQTKTVENMIFKKT
jgi:hypothetical protein